MVGRHPVGVVTGLASEARIVEGFAQNDLTPDRQPRIACAGASARRARRLAQGHVASGARALLSFGIAGGLDPRVQPGRTVLAEALFTPDHHLLPCDAAWRDALATAARWHDLEFAEGRMAGSTGVVSSAAAKARLHALSAAVAVDMESHAVAAVAYDAGVPFIAVRAVADPAGDGLPAIIHGSVDRHGRPRALLVAARLALRPWDLRRLGTLREQSRVAHAALAELRPLAAVLFGGV